VSASIRLAARRALAHRLAEDVTDAVMLCWYASLQRFDTTRGRREIAATCSIAMLAASVERLVDEREQAERVVRAMRLLPAAEREAIVLAYFGGLGYRAVAEQLGVPEETVKVRIRSGLARLQDILAALDPDD
jgi:RNA polymerase sigma-70 factor, ECF subfamily